jgi:hypothetical protein
VRLFASILLDEYDQFAVDASGPDDEDPTPHGEDPTSHGVVRLREFSIQGEAATLRRLAAALLNAADLAEKAARQ